MMRTSRARLEPAHAHGESIGASRMARDRSDDSQGCMFDRKADARMTEVPPRQRVAVDTPCMLEAAGACDPRPVGTTGEPPVRKADSDHLSDGDVERCEVLGWSYFLRSVLTSLPCLAALIAGFQMMSGQVPGEGGVKPSGGVAFGDYVDVPVLPLVSPAQTTEARTLVNAQASMEAAYLPPWFGVGVPLDGVLSCTMGVPGEAGLKEQ